MGTPLLIAYRYFWSGFDPDDFFTPLIAQATGRPAEPAAVPDAHVVVDSVFVPQRPWRRNRLVAALPVRTRLDGTEPAPDPSAVRIWYSGENIRPPADGYDLSLSFDTDTYGGSNLYWPLVLLSVAWPTVWRRTGIEQTRPGRQLGPAQVASPRPDADAADRPKFACAFIGNPEPVRLRAVDALRAHGEVDVYGTAVGRPAPSKHDLAKDYRFMLCFENDLYPGYVTEKPLEAFACGCVPLWRGLDAAGLVNPAALVNAADFEDLHGWAQHVADLDRDRFALTTMATAPLFREVPTLDPLIDAVGHAIPRRSPPA